SRSRRARATRSGRAGWACPRRAWASTARQIRLRSASPPHPASFACTSRMPSGCSTTSTSARRSTSSPHNPGVTLRWKHGLQALTVAVVLGLLALLIWKVVHQDKGVELGGGRTPPAPQFALSRLDAPGKLKLA